jgi:hypothetical protein
MEVGPFYIYIFRIPFVAFEGKLRQVSSVDGFIEWQKGVMMSLTLYKLFGHRKDLNPT